MNEKQYLEAITNLLDEVYMFMVGNSDEKYEGYHAIIMETERRLEALKAQEDNIKSDMWEEKMNSDITEEEAIEILGDNWEDFKEYVDGIDDWGMSDVERYMNR